MRESLEDREDPEMIPSVLARQLRQGVEDFLHTTFPISTPFFHGLIDRLLTEEGNVFRGPYLSVQLPFRRGTGGPDFFPQVPLSFKPYLHQEQAFRRLAGPRAPLHHRGHRHRVGQDGMLSLSHPRPLLPAPGRRASRPSSSTR